HTAPPKKEGVLVGYDFYQWHLEIMPRTSIDAGLELETNVLVNTVDPDEAADILKNITI
ncbi:MAG: galactose-1-phosphate uridylyltransferase, partial [Bacteroidia bacterium]|nr:galactose-1-phosphate uridylyltransferase [Bacteroidia bacterium]